MKKIFVVIGFVLSQFALASTAFADISCSNSEGYNVYLYPGANPNGSRVPVAEFSGPGGAADFMTCDGAYTYCVGKKYNFNRTVYDARVGWPGHGLVAVLKCNK